MLFQTASGRRSWRSSHTRQPTCPSVSKTPRARLVWWRRRPPRHGDSRRGRRSSRWRGIDWSRKGGRLPTGCGAATGPDQGAGGVVPAGPRWSSARSSSCRARSGSTPRIRARRHTRSRQGVLLYLSGDPISKKAQAEFACSTLPHLPRHCCRPARSRSAAARQARRHRKADSNQQAALGGNRRGLTSSA